MNANRNMKIDFRVNGKHDHYIEKSPGRSIEKRRATKKRKRYQ